MIMVPLPEVKAQIDATLTLNFVVSTKKKKLALNI